MAAEYAENGLSLRWAGAEGAGALARTRRALVELSPANPSNVVRALFSLDGGPEREVRGHPVPGRGAGGGQLFALDLPEPPPGASLAWRPVASCLGREADPRRGGLPPATLQAPPRAAPREAAAEPPETPRFAVDPQFLFRITAPLLPDAHSCGETPEGLRPDYFLGKGGTVRGPALSGRILRRGGDWLRVRPDGIGICNVHFLIEADGGGLVMTEYSGLVDFGPDGYRALAAGRGPKRAPLRLTPRYLTSEPRLLWLNRIQGFGVGEVNTERWLVEYDVYALRHVPAAG